MSPKIFLGVLLAVFIAAVLYLFEDELLSAFTDPGYHVDLAESVGVTKAGKPRPSD